jgi:hypothetical protein
VLLIEKGNKTRNWLLIYRDNKNGFETI